MHGHDSRWRRIALPAVVAARASEQSTPSAVRNSAYPAARRKRMTHSISFLKVCGLVCVTGAAPALAAAADTQAAAAQPLNPATAQELQQVIVIGNAPLPGLGLPLNQIPTNVQTANSEDMQRQQVLALADYLNDNFSGINVSGSAGNPFQLDINYHGFTA